jgi:hypothetical protein
MKITNPKIAKNPGPSSIFLFGFIFATILFVICVIARPESLGHNDGLSYFGAVWWTLVPYTIAFLTYAICCFVAYKKIKPRTSSSKAIRILLLIMVIALVGLTITPHTVIGGLHKVFGSSLFASQLVLSLYLLYKNGMNYYIFILVLVMFISGIFSASFLNAPSGYMIQAQIIYQIAFVLILYHYLSRLKSLK